MTLSRLLRRALLAVPLLVGCAGVFAPAPARAGLLGGLLQQNPPGVKTSGVVVQTTGLTALPVVQKALGLLGWTTAWRYDAGNLLVAQPNGLLTASVGTVLSVLNGLSGVKEAEENVLFAVDGRFGGEQSQAPVFANDLNSASMKCQEAIDLVEGRMPPPPATVTAAVAVVDGGFDLGHDEVAGRLLPGFDVLDGDQDPSDAGNLRDDDGDGTADGGIGHGTAVASLVLLLAPTARVYAVRALDDEGVASTASLAAAIDWSIRQGVHVVNVSAGTPVKSQILDQMLARAAYAGIQVVGSAGNTGQEGVSYPANSSYAVAVTGVSSDRVRDAGASYGVEVDAGAPSVRLVAPFPRTVAGYGYWTGTSFAAPLFSATVALGVQAGYGRAREVAARALQSAAPYAYVAPECTGEVGRGIVSVRATLGE
jgi:hypothetical protein